MYSRCGLGSSLNMWGWVEFNVCVIYNSETIVQEKYVYYNYQTAVGGLFQLFLLAVRLLCVPCNRPLYSFPFQTYLIPPCSSRFSSCCRLSGRRQSSGWSLIRTRSGAARSSYACTNWPPSSSATRHEYKCANSTSTDLFLKHGGRERVQDRVQGWIDRQDEDRQPSVQILRDRVACNWKLWFGEAPTIDTHPTAPPTWPLWSGPSTGSRSARLFRISGPPCLDRGSVWLIDRRLRSPWFRLSSSCRRNRWKSGLMRSPAWT